MGIFIYALISIIIFVFLITKGSKKTKYFSVLVLIFIITAFRDTTLGGTDAINYKSFFNLVPNIFDIGNFSHEYGIGYTILNSLAKTVTNDYRVFQVIYTAISIFLLHSVLKKSELSYSNMLLFLLVYFNYTYLWNGFVLLRQNIATLLVWYVFINFKKIRIKDILLLFIAFTFHSTMVIAIALIPIVYIMKKTDKKSLFYTTLCICLILFFASNYIFEYTLRFISIFVGDKYLTYLGIDQSINFINLLLKLMVYVVLFYLTEKSNENSNLFSFSSILMILSSVPISIVGRVSEYFLFAFYLSIIAISGKFEKKDKVIYNGVVFLTFTVIMIRFLLTFSDGQLIEYKWFF